MGNSNNPSMKARMRNVPGQPYGYGRNPRVPGSLNGYDFYANQYPPAQYGNYAYPPNKPVLSSDQYLQNEFFGQPQANYPIIQQPVPIQQPVVPPVPAVSTVPTVPPVTKDTKNRSGHRRHHHSHHHHNHHHPSRHHHHHHLHHNHPDVPPAAKVVSSSPAKEQLLTSIPPAKNPLNSLPEQPIMPASNQEIITPRSVNYSTSMFNKQEPTPSPIVRTPALLPSPLKTTSLELTPVIVTNHVVKSNNKTPAHNYESDTLSIVKRTQSHNSTESSKWYQHNYNKLITPLNTENI